MIETEILVIGAGPVGLFTAFQCGFCNLKYILVDSMEKIGGQCTEIYPQKDIYDIPGFSKISGKKLVENLKKQMCHFPPQETFLGTKVSKIDLLEKGFQIFFFSGECILAKKIIFSTGLGSFLPIKLNMKDDYEGISYMSYSDVTDKTVMVLGGGDSALDAVIGMRLAKKVYLVHRREKFKAFESKIQYAKAMPNVEILTSYYVDKIHSFDNKIDSVEITSCDSKKKIKIDNLVVCFGLAQVEQSFLDLKTKRGKIEVTAPSYVSNIPGVYAVGDCATYEGKINLICTGFSESVHAVRDAHQHIHKKKINFQYSTFLSSFL